MTQLVSLGLDGAAWHKLDRMIDGGELPNLERLVGEGSRGPLRSVRPPVTCPAWRCSTSGKNPGKLGVYWWLNLDRERGTLTTPDSRNFDTVDAWDYLSDEDYRSAILNVPMTYPPSPLDGLMVSGFGAPFELDLNHPITYPPEAAERLRAEHDWQVGVDDVTAPGGLEEALDVIRSRFELLLELLDEGYDYIHLTVFYINVLQHQYGDGPETARAWRLIDDYLGRLPDDVTKLIYSDHGHSHIDRTLVLNKWLIDNGYLELDERASDNVTGGVYSMLNRAGISPRTVGRAAGRVLPDRVFEWLVESGYPIPTFELANRVDWDRSTAMALSQGPVYLNRDRLGDDYGSVRADLRRELRSLSFDGESPFESVDLAEDVYSGPHLDAAPDLMITAADGWEVYGGVTPSVVETQTTSWTSGNHPIGILLLHGPDVTDGELEERSLLDVGPTVLRYFGAAIPSDVDGTPITTPFESLPTDRGTREPLSPREVDGRDRTGGDEENRELERRLEDLGYLE